MKHTPQEPSVALLRCAHEFHVHCNKDWKAECVYVIKLIKQERKRIKRLF